VRKKRGRDTEGNHHTQTFPMPQSTQTVPAPQMVQVLERWNHWVRVRFQASGLETWVNLAETPFAPLTPPTAERKNQKVAPPCTHPSDSRL